MPVGRAKPLPVALVHELHATVSPHLQESWMEGFISNDGETRLDATAAIQDAVTVIEADVELRRSNAGEEGDGE